MITVPSRTFLHPMLAVAMALSMAGGVAATVAPAAAAPASATDETTVPHYFGPYPNWANSPLTTPTAEVTIGGSGTAAAATAEVDPVTGAVTAINVTNPGRDYTGAVSVTVTGSATGDDATATASVSTTGSVVAYSVADPGGGYAEFAVDVAGGGGSGATATASGGVDAVAVPDGGSGYTAPTVDFDLPSSPDGHQAKGLVHTDASGTVTSVEITDPGSGYTAAPGVTIRNGTIFDPVNLADGGVAIATDPTATLQLQEILPVDVGTGYTSAPDVTVVDPVGSGANATATAVVDIGAITGITVDTGGSGYLTQGIKKFQDDLPLPCLPPACPADPAAKYLPIAVPTPKTYDGIEADEYVIGLVQYRSQFNSDLPASLVRGYVQLETADNSGVSQHFGVVNELLDGTSQPVLDADGNQYLAVTPPQYLGPIIAATKDKPVRIVFRNLLPTGADGDLFLPVDSTMMGSGMGPMDMGTAVDEGTVTDMVRNPACTEGPKSADCFKDNRATLHLHGGITPWISDGTPHQWITPAGENTSWPEGVSVGNVPDMVDGNNAVICEAADDGCSTFYYTNQQSARLMFYHDHAWGITRLNVYAGEAAGYLISDATEQKLIDKGTIPGADATLPLIVQDKTFVPDAEQLAAQDPTWDKDRWGTKGNFWYHHVYMPAQNPGDPSGMSAYGRWMYGPWFWPPATNTQHGPIANPYFDPACNLDDPATWQYDTDPFCEPELIPGTPNISAGMEQFNDTPVVNGVAYPTVTVDPKAYRIRVLNAANDRFFNFQWYVADPDPKNGNGQTEVKLKKSELDAAQLDPVVFPTPDRDGGQLDGPDWIQIGTEGGFLPAPVVVDGQQETTWITDPTRFDVGNVDKHSLLLAPAERADAVVDFSTFAGKTLILYNDAPAAFPARVPSYDYYTGGPDLSPVGAPTILPGYGPNTRTVMQVKVADAAAASAFDLVGLRAAFQHKANGSGVFESGQHPIIVGQSTYNSAYGTSFASSSNCNSPNSTKTTCDGYVRVNDTTEFGFNTLRKPNDKKVIKLEPKAIHDEMNASTFDEFGRMTANLGIEAQPPAPGAQNVTLYPYVNPQTELIDATKLPKLDVTYENGLPAGEVQVTPVGAADDGTQLWRVTHNGVDTHPIHFHLYDVQVVNRVTWDNIIIPPDKEELGWKDTVRMAPLEDTIVALRPIIPDLPFEIPNSVRPLNPMMPLGSTAMFNNIDVQGNPTAAITNALVNFGWEYVYHCHILSHEEMDMMRPVSVALPPAKPIDVTTTTTTSPARVEVHWTDNSITETSFLVQRSSDGTIWEDVGTSGTPLDQPNTKGDARSLVDSSSNVNRVYLYRVQALNTVGYGGAFPSLTARSTSDAVGFNPPSAPTSLGAAVAATSPAVALTWTDTAGNEDGFVIERATDGVSFSELATVPARNGTGSVTYDDTTVAVDGSYTYRVRAFNLAGSSPWSNEASVQVVAPAAPTLNSVTAARAGNREKITANWSDVQGETAYTVQWSSTSDFATVAGSGTVGADVLTYTSANITRQVWFVRVRAENGAGPSAWSNVIQVAAAA